MGRMYTVEFNEQTVQAAAQSDLFELAPADDKALVVHAITLAQTNPRVDTDEEILRFRLVRGNATTGSGGSSTTPRPLTPSDTAAAFTAKTNNTTVASTGSPVNLHSDGFNNQAGYQIVFSPEMRPTVTQAQAYLALRLEAPAVAQRMSGTMWVEELG